MKKFTKSICSIIMLCLLVASNQAYSKKGFFFEKTSWAKKGFTSTIAKPDLKLANISIMLGTCTQSGTVTLTNTNTVTFTATTTLATSSSTFTSGTATLTQINTATQTTTVSSSTNTSTATATGTTTFNFAPPVLGAPVITGTGITIPITSLGVGAVNYDVYKKVGGGAFVKINVAPITTLSQYVDTFSPLPSTNYVYQIEARNASGCLSGFSNQAPVTTSALAKAVPTAQKKSPTWVYIQWPNVAGNQGYEILRSQDGINYVTLGINGAQINNFDDGKNPPPLSPGTKYYYIIRTRFANGFSNSDAIDITTDPLPIPTNVSASAINCSRITITWTDPSPNGFSEEEFRVYRSENGGAFNEVARPAANFTSYNDDNLKPNTNYSYQVSALYGGGFLSNRSNTASATTKPSVLNLLSNTATSAEIKWDLCTPFSQGWKIYVSKNDGPFEEAAQVGPQVDKYSFKNLFPQTKYTIYVINFFGTGLGGASNTVAFTTPKFPGPSNLGVAPGGTDNLKVAWKDNSSGPDQEEGFVLYRSTDNGLTYTQVVLPPSSIEYVDKNLKASQKVCYYVVARYFNGFSEPSNKNCEVTCPNGIPEFSKIEAVSPTQINLEWAQPVNLGETTVTIESSLDGVSFSKLADVPGTITSYKDIAVLPNQKKYYRANVKNEGQCSTTYSAIASMTSCPLAPTGVKAKSISSSSVEVNWDLGENMTSYIIERSTDNIDYVLAGEVDGKVSTFIDTKLASSKKYYYRVYAKNAGTCTSAASEVKQESTATTCPTPPSNLVAVASSAKEIKLTFTDNSPDETGFEIEWSKDEKTWTKVGSTLTANTTSATINTGVDAETKYSFRVRALGEICNSDYSNIGSVTTNPLAPTGLTAKGVKINQVDLAWTNTSKIANGIEIQRASGADNNFTEIAKAAAASTSYQNTGLTPATSYKYRIRYTSLNGASDWSNVAEATTLVIAANEDNALAKQISLYPVPTENTLYIKPSGNILGKVSTKIVNISGASLITQDFNGLIDGKTEQINVSSLGAGMYFLEINTLKGSATKKFMKR